MTSQPGLPFSSDSLASVAMQALSLRWLELLGPIDPNVQHPREADTISLACVLLACESESKVDQSARSAVVACRERSSQGIYAAMDCLPWALVEGYLLTGTIPKAIHSHLRNLMGYADSSVRIWFHYVAWMARKELNADSFRPILLQNLADKLGGVEESAGLLAALHPDKAELDRAACDFEPESLPDQYRSRLEYIRERQWNGMTTNLWIKESECRQVIWSAVRDKTVLP